MAISVADLQRMMRDPNTSDAEIRQYFTAATEASRPFSPSIIPDPAKVSVANPADGAEAQVMTDWANSLARLRRQDIFRARAARGDRSPVLVSEGDSWFQFPILINDVIDHLGANYNIWSVDSAGDTLQNMVLDNAEYMHALRAHANSVKAFLFSGAGNDVIGWDAAGKPVLEKLLRAYQPGKPASWYIETEAVARTLRFVEDCYRKVLTNVAAEFPGLPVLCHGYDYAVPGGQPGDTRQPRWARQDEWLGSALSKTLSIRDGGLQREIIRLLVDRLNDRIRSLCGGNVPGGAFRTAWHVEVRESVRQLSLWADELHPTDDGFAQVAARFSSVLSRALAAQEKVTGGATEAAAPEVAAVNPGDDEGVDPAERPGDYHPSPFEASSWRLAASLGRLREQINARFPTRKKREDGSIGDAAHASRNSDHNPWVRDGSTGVVTAVDVTNDPACGCTGDFIAEALRVARDPRVKYIIWNRRICSATSVGGAEAWAWRAYGGSNPHNKHIHISVKSDKALYDSKSDWTLSAEEPVVAVTAPAPEPIVQAPVPPATPATAPVTAPAAAPAMVTAAAAPAPALETRSNQSPLESAPAVARPGPRLVMPGAEGAVTERSRTLDKIVLKGKGEPIKRVHVPVRGGLETVFGVDERVRILDTELDPWRMICALKMQGQNGSSAIGTGWLVGPRTIITAGHCVHSDLFFSGWAKRIEICPGRDGGEFPYKPAVSHRFSSVNRWIDQADPDFDIGCIHLDAPFEPSPGWFSIGALAPQELEGFYVNVSGYPSDRGMGMEQYHHRNRIVRVSERRVFYDIDTYGGQSGAPVWIHETDTAPPLVIGIHAYGLGGSPVGLEANSAPRIIPEVLEQIRRWVEADGGWPQALTS